MLLASLVIGAARATPATGRNDKQLRPQRSHTHPLSGQPDHGGNQDKADQQDAGSVKDCPHGLSAKHYPYSSFSVNRALPAGGLTWCSLGRSIASAGR